MNNPQEFCLRHLPNPQEMCRLPSRELRELAVYVMGVAHAETGTDHTKQNHLLAASAWLNKASANICCHGYFGCRGGDTCTSDHK
jgi:hypothetical protein